MQLWLYTIGSVVLVSLMALAGIVALIRGRDRLDRIITHLVSLAVGALLGGAVLHLIPRSIRHLDGGVTVWLLLLAGFVGSFVLEKFLWMHQHGHHPEHTERVRGGDAGGVRPIVGMILLGDAVHNLIDGVVIAASFMADTSLGLITTLIVLLHEVPQEIGDFGVLVHGGLSAKRALLLNLLSASAAIIGAVLTLLIGTRAENLSHVMLPLAAGNFLYIAAADLIPELHDRRGGWAAASQVILIVLGIGLMLGVRLLREHLV